MKRQIILCLALLLFFAQTNAVPPVEEGKAIFASRCASCHNITKQLTGPALAGVHERRSIDWLVAFVQSSQSIIKSGDKEAVALFEKFNKIPMPDHTDLSADNIKSVIEYIKSESNGAAAEKAPFKRMEKLHPQYIPLSLSKDYGFFISFIAAVVILVAVLVFAVQLKQFQRRVRS